MNAPTFKRGILFKEKKSVLKKERKGTGACARAFEGLLLVRLSLFLAAVSGESELVRGSREVVLDGGVSDLFSFFAYF